MKPCFFIGDSQLTGLLGVADPIKPSTQEAVEALCQEGIRLMMLTGDHEITAQAVARQLDIDEVISGVLPEEKAEAIMTFGTRNGQGNRHRDGERGSHADSG